MSGSKSGKGGSKEEVKVSKAKPGTDESTLEDVGSDPNSFEYYQYPLISSGAWRMWLEDDR